MRHSSRYVISTRIYGIGEAARGAERAQGRALKGRWETDMLVMGTAVATQHTTSMTKMEINFSYEELQHQFLGNS